MEADMFRKWIHQVYTTQDREIDCGQLFDLLSGYVDLQVAGVDAAPWAPQIQVHLAQCAECDDLYHSLLEVAEMEAEGTLPDSAQLLEELRQLTAPREAQPEPVAIAAK
jgi:predicted anti-sigma-YlaC factor YlaD